MIRNIVFSLLIVSVIWAQPAAIHHELIVTVHPDKHSFSAEDDITFPAEMVKQQIFFLLHSNLQVESLTPGVKLELREEEIRAGDFGMDKEDFSLSSDISQKKYAILLPENVSGKQTIKLRFSGEIYHPVKQLSEEYARGFSTSPGIISEQGVYLAGSSYWIPWFNDELITFNLTCSLPAEWDVVSQGKRTIHKKTTKRRITRWESPERMEEVFLIAAPFHEYSYSAGAVEAMAFLRTADENLANKYLETTAQYLEMYRQLIGPYPFAKFALVENFWETGYGMPSFTLLGEKIIRFPFILHSSYPHELLHNWWGNSVYVDFKTGNWCEGITVYMADHLIAEQRGKGAEYRRAALQRYTDYVNKNNDFPLNKFHSRYNAATEAVGYGKSMMLWDMLRGKVGDKLFVKGFQTFYRDNKFRKASFDDIRKSFEAVTGLKLNTYFDQWVNRTGAPELKLSEVRINKNDKEYQLMFTLSQTQEGQPYDLEIPVAVFFADRVQMENVTLKTKEQTYRFAYKTNPLTIQVDPQFNVFRRLNYNEIPPALSKIFGANEILVVLPSSQKEKNNDLYRQLAEIWAKDSSKKLEIVRDDALTDLPDDKPVWLFGRENKFKKIIVEGINDYNASIDEDRVRFGKSTLDAADKSLVITVRNPRNPKTVVVWLTLHGKEALQGLARKLPHYGKYSYLAFEGNEPTNIAKGQWPAVNSPLTASIPQTNGKQPSKTTAQLPVRPPLARLTPVFSAERMMQDVRFLASEELKGRGLGSQGLEKAAEYIVEQFKKAGLQPGGDNGGYFQEWQEVIDDKGDKGTVKNIIGIIPGTKPEFAGQSVLVTAHYDHLGLGWPDAKAGNKGKIHYGADDNASGVAVMLELARTLAKTLKPQRTIIFVAFTAEESGLKGSQHYIKAMKTYPAEKIIGVLNLDTVGRLGKNKLLVLGSNSAREWKFIFMGAGYVTGVEAEMVTQDLDASDQVSFIRAGIPGVQFFSGAHRDYHSPGDTADKIDAAGMVKVATFVREAILYLAEREEPLTFTGKSGAQTSSASKQTKSGERRASTGSMPDFAFSGKGVRLQSVAPDSPAEKAGLKAGDIILKLGKYEVSNLRDYSNALKSYQPDDTVELEYLRNGKTLKTKITLGVR